VRAKAFIISLLTVILLVFIGIVFFSKPIPEPPIYEGEPVMDHRRAYENIRELCESFPRRSIFHKDNRLAVKWLRMRLSELGLETGVHSFDSWSADEKVEGLENVYGISRGTTRPDEIIIVNSHLDIPEFVYQGAADAGSDVGIILELARVFSMEDHNRTFMFLFTNNEEYGMRGAYNFINDYEDIDQVAAVLVMDYMNMGDYGHTMLRFEGMQKGYTPLWLRELTATAAAREGNVRQAGPLMEWVQRSVTIATTDVGMFLSAGVPAVNIRTLAVDEKWQHEIYHTEKDTMEHIRLDTVELYGNTTERILRSLDTAPQIPPGEMNYFKYNDRYLPGWLINTIQIVLFFPFFLLLGIDLRQGYADNLGLALRRVGLSFLFIFLSGMTGYLLLRFLPFTDLMYRNELVPSTPKDPILYAPQYVPVMLVIAAIVITAVILFKIVLPRISRLNEAEVSDGVYNSSHWLLMFLLAVIIIITWVEGSGFAAVAFLPLAWLWPWIISPAKLSRRILNIFLLLAWCPFFIAVVHVFASWDIGVMWWIFILSVASGLFSYKAVFVFLWAASLLLAMFPLAWGNGRKTLNQQALK